MNVEIPFILDALQASKTIEVQVEYYASLEHPTINCILFLIVPHKLPLDAFSV